MTIGFIFKFLLFYQTLLTFLHFLEFSFFVESFVWFSCDRIVRREVAQIDWISLTFFALLQTQVSDKAPKLFTFEIFLIKVLLITA